jgi:hypothetical protein
MSPRSSARRWPDPRFPLAAGLAAAALLALAAPAAAEPAGEVRFVAGSAQLTDAAGRQKPLTAGTELQAGDRVVTGAGGRVQFRLSDGSLVLVHGDSDVAIETYRFRDVANAGALLHLRLTRGVLRAQTGAAASRSTTAYRVVTPTATIASRGADHEPAFIPEPRWGETPAAPPGTYDRVYSGATVIEAFGSRVEVLPGQVGFAAAVAHAPPQILATPPAFLNHPVGGDSALAPGGLLPGVGLPGVAHRHRLPRVLIVPGVLPGTARPDPTAGTSTGAGHSIVAPLPGPVVSPLPGPVVTPLAAPVVSPLTAPVVSPPVPAAGVPSAPVRRDSRSAP